MVDLAMPIWRPAIMDGESSKAATSSIPLQEGVGVFRGNDKETWMAGTSPAMTAESWARVVRLQRDVVVLLPRVLELFVAQHL